MNYYMNYDKEFHDNNIYETEYLYMYLILWVKNGNYLSCGVYPTKILLDIMN
jgi:hypothetical protein